MKRINIKILSLVMIVLFSACDVDYENNPNEITDPPTSGLLNDAVKKMMDDLYDEWFMGRFTQVTVQYWTQTAYADEDRYVYRESQRETWEQFYRNAENIRRVIQLNTDESTKTINSQYGSNNNQIAVARILLSFTFNVMADTWGDIPYYSYGSDDADFQALNLAGAEMEILSPKYAEQSKIYKDILNELQEAEAMINVNETGVVGDNIFNGDMALWKKFANSLRLRVAIKIKGVDATTANSHITDAVNKGVFTSNSDNAGFGYEAAATNAAPFYVAFNVSNRADFAISHPFTQLLLGNNLVDHSGTDIVNNPFEGMMDPRIEIYAKKNSNGDYVGMPISDNSADAGVYSYESPPGAVIIDKPDYTQYLMEFAEVSFILSEVNNWDQTNYENGVRASMSKWGVAQADIDSYVSNLPPASMETVLTQKYIALYMDAHTAWQEYRRTGYPMTLLTPGTEFSVTPVAGTTLDYTFTSLVEGVTDLPFRLQYPDFERTLNGDNRDEAVSRLSKGDVIDSKLWWDMN
ncbi:SusD/RagB family nutrient-binding outer membrane lipoprotein [Thalassobellus suaedae]|uniref:SusD/RagB family nutrient-binding outer membrane lipoprotein n=1 Tax=Thalassobellus suaedae TaxID=3074124 RepID=A0ABY9XQK2_9FLAO|nr:SusD/RagB family nutrient-binding outer membrane lipoprotein [Flavobacteriaceae bacterium HL-DH14]WNH13407.1 SusD/RagB family nutrient-binding outer membrane lipoprotein [Flavobacteriaceae bacterium HL-DH10]